MFDISLTEILVVSIVGLAVLGPKELPTVVKGVRQCVKKVRGFGKEVNRFFDHIEGVSDLKQEARKLNMDLDTIVDLDGKEQEAYNVEEVMRDLKKSPKNDKSNK